MNIYGKTRETNLYIEDLSPEPELFGLNFMNILFIFASLVPGFIVFISVLKGLLGAVICILAPMLIQTFIYRFTNKLERYGKPITHSKSFMKIFHKCPKLVKLFPTMSKLQKQYEFYRR